MITNMNQSIDLLETKFQERTKIKFAREELLYLQNQLKAGLEAELAANFIVKANKTYLVTDDDSIPMTADQRKDWIASQIVQDPSYAEWEQQIRSYTKRLAILDDDIVILQMRYRVATIDANRVTALINAGTLNDT